MTSTVTLLTDFGLRDQFVAAMKGVILGVNADVTLVDITHVVPPQDVFGAAFTLGQAWSLFPQRTVHLAVVDPGVGTARKALVAAAGGHYFVAPDNGILTFVMDAEDFVAYEITAEHYFRKPVSTTFHGRDVFAPIAAWLSRGIPIEQIGTPLQQPVRLKVPVAKKVREGLVQGAILSVDQYGNLITNLKPSDVPPGSRVLLAGGQREVTTFRRTYGEGKPGELFLVPGSTGFLEITLRDGSAASLLDMKVGAPIGVAPA